MSSLTDEEIRIDWLCENAAMKPSEAKQYVKDHPKPTMLGEAAAIGNERIRDFGKAVANALRGKK